MGFFEGGFCCTAQYPGQPPQLASAEPPLGGEERRAAAGAVLATARPQPAAGYAH
jgi:hypothetical protein